MKQSSETNRILKNALLSSPRDPIIVDSTSRPKEMLLLRYESGRVKLVKLKSQLNFTHFLTYGNTHFLIQDNLSSAPIRQLVSSGDANWLQNQKETSVQLCRHAWRRAPFLELPNLLQSCRASG